MNKTRLEPWPGYFDLRSKEIEVLFNFWKPENVENFLEVGCGLGFVSRIFSDFAGNVFATDLFSANEGTHTLGMKRAVKYLIGEHRKNVFLLGADASLLPVRSASMDTVFSMNILEHIPVEKRDGAIQEMKRALRDNGRIVAIMPSFTERIGNFFYYYFDLAVRLVRKVFTVNASRGRSITSPGRETATGIPVHRLTGKLLPPIHGAYRSRLEELHNQLPWKWEALFRRNGLDIVKTFTIRFLPFSTKTSIWLYKKTHGIDSFLGGKAPFKYFGKNYCIIAKAKR